MERQYRTVEQYRDSAPSESGLSNFLSMAHGTVGEGRVRVARFLRA